MPNAIAECALFVLWDDARRLVLMEDRQDFLPEGQRDRQYFVFPGGKVEPDEAPWNAMMRECREETGCEVLEWQEIVSPVPLRSRFNQHNFADDFEGWFIHAYLVTRWSGVPPRDSLENSSVPLQWVDPSTLDATPDGNTCTGEILQLLMALI